MQKPFQAFRHGDHGRANIYSSICTGISLFEGDVFRGKTHRPLFYEGKSVTKKCSRGISPAFSLRGLPEFRLHPWLLGMQAAGGEGGKTYGNLHQNLWKRLNVGGESLPAAPFPPGPL